MSGIIRWEDPPAEKPKAGIRPALHDWRRIAAQLRDRPGSWAVVSERAAPPVPVHIRQATYSAFAPAGSFDAVGRRVDGVYMVFARFIGEHGEYR